MQDREEEGECVPLRASKETAFWPTVNNRVYWSIIKEVVFVNFACSQFSIIHVLTDDLFK